MLIALIIAFIIIVLILAIWIARRQRRKGRAVVAGGGAGEAANNQVYVGNLSYQVNEQDLKEFFGKYGNIEQVRIVRNYASGRSKGFGFVSYRSTAEANNSLAAHGQKYKDRTIVVRIAKPR